MEEVPCPFAPVSYLILLPKTHPAYITISISRILYSVSESVCNSFHIQRIYLPRGTQHTKLPTKCHVATYYFVHFSLEIYMYNVYMYLYKHI